MDEFELRAFSCTAEFSSLSKAALFLRVSQPAISRSIRNLEEALNTTLLIRHGRGVTLTTDGQRFLEHAKSIVDSMDRAKRDLIALRAEPQGTVKFGMPTSVGSVLLPKLTRGFKAHYPGVILVGIEAGSVELFEWLLEGRLDVAVIHEPSPSKSLVIEEVLLQRLYLVGRPTPDFGQQGRIVHRGRDQVSSGAADERQSTKNQVGTGSVRDRPLTGLRHRSELGSTHALARPGRARLCNPALSLRLARCLRGPARRDQD
jgi:DNA-binding transcriptional LysR family regulator